MRLFFSSDEEATKNLARQEDWLKKKFQKFLSWQVKYILITKQYDPA